jgi:hypothetical protein
VANVYWLKIHLPVARRGGNLAVCKGEMRLEVDLEMYVRWQKQQRPYNRLYWAAQLVTIARVNGVPKQKHLAYLAGIAEDSKGIAEARRTFWIKATAALDALRKLKPEDRQKIERSLATRVPPPTGKQLKRQQLQGLKHSLQLAQQRVQAIKLEMRAVREQI